MSKRVRKAEDDEDEVYEVRTFVLPFARIAKELVYDRDVSDAAFRAFCVLCSAHEAGGGNLVPRALEALGISREALGARVDELVALGWLSWADDGALVIHTQKEQPHA